MSQSITLLDGAVGTNLWALAAERDIPKVPVWQYNITHPELVSLLAQRFVAAGSEIILSNTFCANGPMVAKYPGFRPGEVVTAGVGLARAAADGAARVALSVGPLDFLPADREERLLAAAAYDEQIGAGVDAGAELIFLQTFWEKELLILAAERAARYDLPLLCAMTFGPEGYTYGGCTPAEMAEAVAPFHPEAVGLNCSGGAVASVPVMEAFRRCTEAPLLFKPNMPPEHTPGDFVSAVAPALGYVRYIGGCCGTTPEDIAALARSLQK